MRPSRAQRSRCLDSVWVCGSGGSCRYHGNERPRAEGLLKWGEIKSGAYLFIKTIAESEGLLLTALLFPPLQPPGFIFGLFPPPDIHYVT